MSNQIARTLEPIERFFPDLTADFYDNLDVVADLKPSQIVAKKLLTKIDHNLSPLQMYAGRGLSDDARFTRILKLHREAVQAELKGEWERVQYFWDWVADEAKRLYHADSFWEQSAQSLPDSSPMRDAAVLKDRFYAEVLLDTHIAFYNGWQNHQSDRSGVRRVMRNRADFHQPYIEMYSDVINLPDEQRKAMQYHMYATRLLTHTHAKAWDKAIDACRKLLDLYPDRSEFAIQLIKLNYNYVMDGVLPPDNKTSPHVSKNAIAQIKARINGLINLTNNQNIDDLALLYDYIGSVYFIWSLHEGRAGDLPDAMVYAQKAVDYNPSLLAAHGVIYQLKTNMSNLTTQMNTMLAQVRRTPNARLTADGQRLKKMVNRGDKPLTRYLESRDRKEFIERVKKARAESLWQRIGFEEAYDEALASDLVTAMDDLTKQKQINIMNLNTSWDTIVANHPNVQQLDQSKIKAYLVQQFLKSATPPKDDLQLDIQTPDHAPQIDPTVQFPVGGRSPDAYLLFTRDNLALKLWTLAACIGIVFAIGSVINRMQLAGEVESNYVAAQATYDADYDAAAATVTQQAMDAQATYDAEFARVSQEFSESRDARDANYDVFVEAYGDKDYETAFDAALDFLEDKTDYGLEDPRRQQIISAYEALLVDFALQPGSNRDTLVFYTNALNETTSN